MMRGSSQFTRIEMSTDDGETWEKINLPGNCHPYHQVNKFGTYEETTDEGVTQYRRAY